MAHERVEDADFLPGTSASVFKCNIIFVAIKSFSMFPAGDGFLKQLMWLTLISYIATATASYTRVWNHGSIVLIMTKNLEG